MAKGTPTDRSRRFKANQEKKSSTPSNLRNDAFPSPPLSPIIQAEGALRAFATVRVLHQSLLHAASPGTHPHDLLQVMGSYLYDCSQWYNEEHDRNTALQKQLDDANSKFIAQDAEILQLQDLLKKSQEQSEFYRQQAVQADLVTPRRRCRIVSSDADNVLTPDELYQQLLWARDDIQVRDRALARLKVQHTELQASFEQVLTSSSALLTLHVTLLEHHLQLQARLKVSASAATHYRNQFLEYQTKLDAQLTSSQQTSSQLQETSAKYDKLAAQVTQEDPIVRSIVDHGFRKSPYTYPAYADSHLRNLSDQLLVFRPHLKPRPSTPRY